MSAILLNDSTVNTPNGPILVRAGETVVDPGLLAALPGVGGVLWPSNDATVSAAATIALKLRNKGADERIVTGVMIASAANMLAQSDVAASYSKLTADGAAATPTAETPMGLVSPSAGGNVLFGYFQPAAALTADPANNATILIQKRTAGGAPVTIATVTTTTAAGGTGNWTAWQPVLIPAVALATVAPLDGISWSITKGGTGVVVPLGTIVLFIS